MKLLLATGNPGKLTEMRKLLFQLGIEIAAPAELGIDVEIEETGATFLENARLKAQNALARSGLPSIGEDSGLCVDALDGAPGLYSKRFGGEGLTAGEQCALIIEKLGETEQRAAKFVSTIVCVFPGGDELIATGECAGEIVRMPRGDEGFGYDPIFFLPEYGKTMAELTQDEKNTISHRGASMRSFALQLESYIRAHTRLKEKIC